jgi:hypothetical protein
MFFTIYISLWSKYLIQTILLCFDYKICNYYLITFINNNKYGSQQSNHYRSGYPSPRNLFCIFQSVSEKTR